MAKNEQLIPGKQYQFKQLWQLKDVKFDIDLDDKVRNYEKYLIAVPDVEVINSLESVNGYFYMTNLRVVFHHQKDRTINLSIGLDTITNINLQSPLDTGKNQWKIIFKCKVPFKDQEQAYQFKFRINSKTQPEVFKKAINVFQQLTSTKSYRSIDTDMKVNFDNNKFETLPREIILNSYSESKYSLRGTIFECEIILTNIRLVLLVTAQGKGKSYGIPWIMLESYKKISKDDYVFALKLRKIIIDQYIEIVITPQKGPKFEAYLTSLALKSNENPVLGISIRQPIIKINRKSLFNTSIELQTSMQQINPDNTIKEIPVQFKAEQSGSDCCPCHDTCCKRCTCLMCLPIRLLFGMGLGMLLFFYLMWKKILIIGYFIGVIIVGTFVGSFQVLCIALTKNLFLFIFLLIFFPIVIIGGIIQTTRLHFVPFVKNQCRQFKDIGQSVCSRWWDGTKN